MRTLFVDGYNVINSWPSLKKVKEYSYESSRVQLIGILQNYVAFKGYKMVIVFDAQLVKGSIQKKERQGNLVVVFTKEGETADNYIEKMVNDIGRNTEVCVITSDSLEQQITFQRGATRMSSIEFYHEVVSTQKKIEIEIERKYLEKRNWLEERIDEKTLEKLEKMRRSR
ncbi:NYN domain-containing protein [Clostridium estertheticum]|uniref:RNA-binding protein n=2 Tax=Clostridium estertheticum TaxID=238834 RepID=A0A1J0GLT2_9CLOT|nr:NYN domain-containing protein [Clostridium estertheticum]APC42362.1 RNA-binding protein [Clostridium estertheticum subsp. estertheticum]MBU3172123.1 NYN domain-containing protein [Clostridium estertheticum]MBU3186488.1 NYN domain-containing protein [Clostridium estertheticum]MBZ9615701.1 NYN domain-containing protein [Clostridium estertheticum subsp. laramiense]MCB2343341.1 NYN domain-containing protein [Clostridium estertheticum]